jgi:hypothetical protein
MKERKMSMNELLENMIESLQELGSENVEQYKILASNSDTKETQVELYYVLLENLKEFDADTSWYEKIFELLK